MKQTSRHGSLGIEHFAVESMARAPTRAQRQMHCYICSPLHYDSEPPSLVLFGPDGPIYHRSLPYRKAIRVAYRLECRRRLDIVVTIAQYLLPALLPRKPTRRSPETTETGPGTHCIRYSPPGLPSKPCARVTSLSCGTARSEAEKKEVRSLS